MLVGAAQLTIDEGVVVKFGTGAGLVVRDTLRIGPGVVFTSLADDSIGGQSQPTAGTPQAGDWSGVTLDPAVLPANVTLDGLRLRYAGGAGGAALSFQQRDYAFTELSVRDSLIGVRAASGGTALLSGFLLSGNGVGLQALGGATPTLTGSDLHDNARFGVENQNPATVVLATGNWWGDLQRPGRSRRQSQRLGRPGQRRRRLRPISQHAATPQLHGHAARRLHHPQRHHHPATGVHQRHRLPPERTCGPQRCQLRPDGDVRDLYPVRHTR
ncbi:MAG: hypothetical protein V9G29_03490 [Burkholderiaceae bacterium]